MTAAVAPTPQERGWVVPILALVAFLLLPVAAPWFAAVLPVRATYVFLLPALAACMLVGWWRGGRLAPAILWTVLTVWLLYRAEPRLSAYDFLVWGWGITLAAVFGVVSILDARRPFFARALLAATLTLVLGGGMALAKLRPSRLEKVLASQDDRYIAGSMVMPRLFEQRFPDGMRRALAAVSRKELGTLDALEQGSRNLAARSKVVLPAMLLLESLAALALAWTLYHRLHRARLGPALGPLREFRFNDQLVWGLIVGLTIALLPTLAAYRGLGANLLLFFSALYALRGIGVLAWFAAPGGPVTSLLLGLLTFIFPVLTVALGVGDIWFDWRRRVRPTPGTPQ